MGLKNSYTINLYNKKLYFKIHELVIEMDNIKGTCELVKVSDNAAEL